jgi:hypothetical protein
MTVSFSIKSILAVSLVLIMSFMSSIAGAWVSGTSSSNLSCTPTQILLGQCSIKSSGALKGLGNTTNDQTAYSVDLLIEAGSIEGVNPAFNADPANGTPFGSLAINVSASSLVDAEQISRNGRATKDIIFHDDELIAAVLAALDSSCSAGDLDACAILEEINSQIAQHPNWHFGIVVTQMQVLGKQWTDEVGGCDLLGEFSDDHTGCTLTDALGSTCTAPQDVQDDPGSYLWVEFDYDCTEVCHNTDKKSTSCPADLPL